MHFSRQGREYTAAGVYSRFAAVSFEAARAVI